MNMFRLAGDMSHVFSIIVLLLRLRVVKNAAGKSIFHIYSYLLAWAQYSSSYGRYRCKAALVPI
jgi:ER lumen protein retaining receptor